MTDPLPEADSDAAAAAARTALDAGDGIEAMALVADCLARVPDHPAGLRVLIDLARQAGDLAGAADAAGRLEAAMGNRLSYIDRRLIDSLAGRPLAPPPPLPDLAPGFRLFDDFLPADLHRTLLDYCLGQDETASIPGEDRAFHAATVVAEDRDLEADREGVRQAWVMGCPAARLTDLVVDRVRALIPETAPAIGVGTLSPGEIEVQITAHGDGAFYKPHQDGSLDPASPIHRRRVSFVYYLHAPTDDGSPPFGGGDLKLYDTTLPAGTFNIDRFTRVAPKDNRLILFDSLFVHEVCPVRLDDDNPRHRRLTVNGWVHPSA